MLIDIDSSHQLQADREGKVRHTGRILHPEIPLDVFGLLRHNRPIFAIRVRLMNDYPMEKNILNRLKKRKEPKGKE